ncbi:hypothetical protein MKK55_25735, partial [Methylobacterium sp. J-059]|uniref:hypothetical protein n=1 Tax=Methylobacterium sp. J-059 TaxID=2836643 RepID=UPI001FB8E059
RISGKPEIRREEGRARCFARVLVIAHAAATAAKYFPSKPCVIAKLVAVVSRRHDVLAKYKVERFAPRRN